MTTNEKLQIVKSWSPMFKITQDGNQSRGFIYYRGEYIQYTMAYYDADQVINDAYTKVTRKVSYLVVEIEQEKWESYKTRGVK